MIEFNNDDLDVLEELMNIAFGSAAAEMSEIIDVLVTINVPKVRIIKDIELKELLYLEGDQQREFHICEQSFQGEFSGTGIVVVSADAENKILTQILGGDDLEKASLRSSLLQITNLLVSSCVHKFNELIQTQSQLSAPRITLWGADEFLAPKILDGEEQLILSSHLSILDKNNRADLHLLCNYRSHDKIKQGVDHFMEEYE